MPGNYQEPEKIMDLNLMREWWSAKRQESGDHLIVDCWDHEMGMVYATYNKRSEALATLFAASGPLFQALGVAQRIIQGDLEKTPMAMNQIESALRQAMIPNPAYSAPVADSSTK